jgi:hypothetical protein
MMLRYMVLGGLLTLMLFPTALGELTSFKLIYGGSGLDAARDIYADSSGIYMVGVTSSFGGNPPNAYLTIFNTDNTHRCSVAVDLTGNEEGVGGYSPCRQGIPAWSDIVWFKPAELLHSSL